MDHAPPTAQSRKCAAGKVANIYNMQQHNHHHEGGIIIIDASLYVMMMMMLMIIIIIATARQADNMVASVSIVVPLSSLSETFHRMPSSFIILIYWFEGCVLQNR